MKRAHVISGALIVVMVIIMQIPGILVYPRLNTHGYTGEYLPGHYGHPHANGALAQMLFPALFIAILWGVKTFMHIYEPRVFRIVAGACCLLLCLNVLPKARSAGPVAICALAGVALAIQSVAFTGIEKREHADEGPRHRRRRPRHMRAKEKGRWRLEARTPDFGHSAAGHAADYADAPSAGL